MKFLSEFDHYRDGGSIGVNTDKGYIFVDGFMDSKTKGKVFLGDITDEKAEQVTDELREEFLEAVQNVIVVISDPVKSQLYAFFPELCTC